MKKKLLTLALAAALLVSGCSTRSSEVPASAPDELSSQEESPMLTDPPTPASEPPEALSLPSSESSAEETDPLAGLTENQSGSLSITAAVLVRRAILPGSSIPVNISITNEGDQSVIYVLGSGSFETPQALIVQSDTLQPVRPRDHLGPATMDYVTKELKPGESLQFAATLMAVTPSEDFDQLTYDLYYKENTYVADMAWQDLQEAYPQLTAVQPGLYTGTVSFRYLAAVEGEPLNPFLDASEYVQAKFEVNVTE